MSTYKAGFLPDNSAGLLLALREEFARLEKALNEPQDFDEYRVLHASPTRLRKGMEVLADGSDWNPGQGPGKYVRNEANTAWVFLGYGDPSFSPGSFTVRDETANLRGCTLNITASDTVTLEGTGELILLG